MKNLTTIFLLGLTLLLLSCQDDEVAQTDLCTISELEFSPINEFQVIASHNSYRKRTYAPIFYLFYLATNIIPEDWVPDGIDPAIQWDYNHVAFPKQFDNYNIRSLEIDLYYDPEGGNFYNRLGNALVRKPIASWQPALQQPGMKVMHIPHLDYMTHYLTLIESLNAIQEWSNDHPDHFPISVMLELKEAIPFNIPEVFNPFTENGKNAIAEEILSVFDEDQLITPNDLRTHSTLYESIQANGWPTLAESRGKIMFFVTGEDEIANVIFGANSNNNDNDNHIFKVMNDATGGGIDNIKEAVNNGMMVRSRADAGTIEARSGDTESRDMAFLSGAQIISTDYYKPDLRYLFHPQEWSDYKVQWPEGYAARSNVDFNCFAN